MPAGWTERGWYPFGSKYQALADAARPLSCIDRMSQSTASSSALIRFYDSPGRVLLGFAMRHFNKAFTICEPPPDSPNHSGASDGMDTSECPYCSQGHTRSGSHRPWGGDHIQTFFLRSSLFLCHEPEIHGGPFQVLCFCDVVDAMNSRRRKVPSCCIRISSFISPPSTPCVLLGKGGAGGVEVGIVR